MKKFIKPEDVVLKEANAVVQFTLIAFEPGFLKWDKETNLQVAEFIWNCGNGKLGTAAVPGEDPDMRKLIRKLRRARTSTYRKLDSFVLDLDIRLDVADWIFTFNLSWDEFDTLQPCEIVWTPEWADDSILN